MWITNLTALVNSEGKINFYTFNPSLLFLEKKGRDSFWLCTYRVIYYDLRSTFCPWSVWNATYKMFRNAKQAASHKYRRWFGSAYILPTHGNVFQPVVDGEVDTTGLCCLKLVGGTKFELEWNIPQLFPREYNQDCRLYHLGGKIMLVYNVFEPDRVGLRYRTLEMRKDQISLSEERYLFAQTYRDCEKHCFAYPTMDTIHYAIGEEFVRLEQGKMVKTSCTLFDSLLERYGKANVLISLATPPISWSNRTSLACGHIKICYKTATNFTFLQHIQVKGIKPHGKYIYFAFFYEFSATHVLRISPLFIPTMHGSHLPFLLFMPIGLTTDGDKVILSGGEGDVRMRVIAFQRREIEQLLETKTDPCFLTEQMTIHHVGYFQGHQNCGDDAFRVVFEDFERNSPHIVTFGDTFDPKASINVLGGGDVINKWWLHPPESIPSSTIALGVGIPYPEFVPLLASFPLVYLRNARDQAKFKDRFAPKTVLRYVPDLTFHLAQMWGTVPTSQRQAKTVGIILTRTYYHTQHLVLYQSFCDEMGLCITRLIQSGFHVVMIPFCTNERNKGENDYLILEDILKLLKCDKGAVEIFHPDPNDLVRQTYWKVGQMSFNICTRFHSHIFSTIHGVPFVSLTCGRKCIEYMADFPELLFQLKANEMDLPIDFHGEMLFHFVKEKWAQRDVWQEKIQAFQALCLHQEKEFAMGYLNLLRKYAKPGTTKMVLWLPPKQVVVDGSSPCHELGQAFMGMGMSMGTQNTGVKEEQKRETPQTVTMDMSKSSCSQPTATPVPYGQGAGNGLIPMYNVQVQVPVQICHVHDIPPMGAVVGSTVGSAMGPTVVPPSMPTTMGMPWTQGLAVPHR